MKYYFNLLLFINEDRFVIKIFTNERCESIRSWRKDGIFIDEIIHFIIIWKNSWRTDQSDENKDRVLFYMSIPTTMKFKVRGKSVDLINHEGSSPSIPKRPVSLSNFFSIIKSLFICFIRFILSQLNGNFSFLFS